ncbi:MAG: VanZ family protein [Woeseiaceae bacterium]|nr:VanZ family protein [Woeseiaceae bacterium]
MLPLQYQRRWKIAGVLLLIAVLTVAMAPPLFPWPGTGSPWLMLSDKWQHGITFASMVVWYSGQYARRSYWLLALGLLAFGLLIEFCQSLVSYRTAESGDLIADILGILVGLAIALVGLGGWSARVESWLQSKHG